MMAHEIELKLALPESAQTSFGRLALLKSAQDKQTFKLFNVYYDTPDLALREKGVTLRLRREGNRWLQTIKCVGEMRAGLSSRPEWEVPYLGHFDFSVIEDESLRAWLDRRRLRDRLMPVFETNFQRTVWLLEPEPVQRIAIMLDKGWIVAAGRREAISEVELELLSGQLTALFALANALAERLPLVPVRQSKAERGYALYRSLMPTPVRARPVELSRGLSPLAALRRIAFSCLEHLQDNHAGALQSDDPEYIHQMRVAARRLRAALRLFAPLLPSSFNERVLPPLQNLMTVLGAARDLDVLLTEIVSPVLTDHPDEPRLAELIGLLTERRYAARQHALQLLSSPAFGQHLLLFLDQFHHLDEASIAGGKSGPYTLSLPAFARERLNRLRRKVLKLAARARIDDAVSLHTLRIAIKRLRYALEFFAPLAAKKSLDRTVRALAGMQDTLGQINDLANASRLLAELSGNDERLMEAVRLIAEWHDPRRQQLLAAVPDALARLHELPLPRLRVTGQ